MAFSRQEITYIHDWESHLQSPSVHDFLDAQCLIQTALLMRDFGQALPKIVLDGIVILVLVQVLCQSVIEAVLAQEVGHHANDAGTLAITDPVENLVNLIWVMDFHRNWMRSPESIAGKSRIHFVQGESLHQTSVWLNK